MSIKKEKTMNAMEYIEKLNKIKTDMAEEREAVYDEYCDHSDDAELCWSQRREEWDADIEALVEEAHAAGVPVWFDSDRREWILKEEKE